MKEPCIDCLDEQIDSYGYVCDIACGKRSAWINHHNGIKEVVEWIKSHQLIKPDKDSVAQFYPFY